MCVYIEYDTYCSYGSNVDTYSKVSWTINKYPLYSLYYLLKISRYSYKHDKYYFFAQNLNMYLYNISTYNLRPFAYCK